MMAQQEPTIQVDVATERQGRPTVEEDAPPRVRGKSKQPTERRSHERLDTLEAQMATVLGWVDNVSNLDECLSVDEYRIEVVHNRVDTLEGSLEGQIQALESKLAAALDKLEVLHIAFKLQQRSQVAPNPIARHKTKVPEPQTYSGVRSSKEVENFIFDMEEYFLAVTPESEQANVTLVAMYLKGDAKLWWRTKRQEIEQGSVSINSWADLKKELKTQFMPENIDILAQKKLRNLSQMGLIEEYVRAFPTCMLDIRDMSEKDKLFYFMEGLKLYAYFELNR